VNQPDPLGTINQIPCSPEICDNFLDDDGNGLVDNDEPGCQLIGGTYIPIDQSALLLAGVQSISMWMIPVLIAGIGIGVFVIKRRK